MGHLLSQAGSLSSLTVTVRSTSVAKAERSNIEIQSVIHIDVSSKVSVERSPEFQRRNFGFGLKKFVE